MEELTKSQIVLLTLLVSFVTSIATGIVTVSLMDQAPPAIAQTVNRIVERTVEAAAPTTGQPAATVITQEKTVVVKESDLISQAVDKASPSLVRVYTSDAEDPQFMGLAVVMDKSGDILADTGILGERAEAVGRLSDGSTVRIFVSSRNNDAGVAFLVSATSTVDGKVPVWRPATFATGQAVLGQTIVVLAGKSATRIAPGVVTAVGSDSKIVETNIDSNLIMAGSPIINTDGSIVGVSTEVARASSNQGFMPSAALMPKKETKENATDKR